VTIWVISAGKHVIVRRTSGRHGTRRLNTLRGVLSSTHATRQEDGPSPSERLPDDCSLEDVLYHLYVIQKVEAGLADSDAAILIPHEQVAEELRRKWVKGAA